MLFLKEKIENIDFEKKISRLQNSMWNYPVGGELNTRLQLSSEKPAV